MKVLLLGRPEFDYEYIISTIEKKDRCILYYDKYPLKVWKNLNPDFIISYNYRFILGTDIINRFKNKIINLHISYLPWNRGADPNLWSWIDKTIKGVTIHEVDEGIDTGSVLVQEATIFKKDPNLTLEMTWTTLHAHIQYMFEEYWDYIHTGERSKITLPQMGKGSFHFLKERPHLAEGWETKVADL